MKSLLTFQFPHLFSVHSFSPLYPLHFNPYPRTAEYCSCEKGSIRSLKSSRHYRDLRIRFGVVMFFKVLDAP